MTCISHMTLQRFSCFSYTTISTLVWYLKKSLIKSELSSLDKRFQNVIRCEFKSFICFNEKVNRLFKSKLFECINNSVFCTSFVGVNCHLQNFTVDQFFFLVVIQKCFYHCTIQSRVLVPFVLKHMQAFSGCL